VDRVGRTTSARTRLVVTVALGVALLATGCSGSSGGTPSAQTQTQTATGTPTAGTPSTTPTQKNPTKKKKKNVVAWVLSLGPGAPDGPPEFTAYRELQQLHCATVFDRVKELNQPARKLYTAAAQACLAAFDGRSDLWTQASTAYGDVAAAPLGDFNCMDRAALALLARLVTLHEQHPKRSFEGAPSTEAKAPPCPSIRGLSPDHGLAGTVVRLTGRHLDENVAGIDIVDSSGNSQPAVNVTQVGHALEFTMPEAPPSDASSLACIVVRANPDWSADGALFRYDSANAGQPTTFDCPAKSS
jgi:hypothetical protein